MFPNRSYTSQAAHTIENRCEPHNFTLENGVKSQDELRDTTTTFGASQHVHNLCEHNSFTFQHDEVMFQKELHALWAK